MVFVRSVLLVVLLACARMAEGHPAPYSYVDLHLDAGGVRGSLVLHVFDVAHELGVADPDRLLEPETLANVAPALRSMLHDRFRLNADGRRLSLRWNTLSPAPDRHGMRLEFDAVPGTAGRVEVNTTLFPYDPQHQTFVNVYEDGDLRHQAVLDARRLSLEYYAGSVQGVTAVLATFIPAGIHHILIGPDHVLFLIALVILGGTLLRLLTIVTAFTVGHSITLSLAATGIVSPPSSIVEPAIALSIIVVGVDNLLVRRSRDTRDLRPLAALSFGLIHGFGFAAVLREIGLPPTALGWSLFSFNVGVEIGQIVIVGVVASAILAIRRRNQPLAERLALAASVVVIVAGAWWFAERVFA